MGILSKTATTTTTTVAADPAVQAAEDKLRQAMDAEEANRKAIADLDRRIQSAAVDSDAGTVIDDDGELVLPKLAPDLQAERHRRLAAVSPLGERVAAARRELTRAAAAATMAIAEVRRPGEVAAMQRVVDAIVELLDADADLWAYAWAPEAEDPKFAVQHASPWVQYLGRVLPIDSARRLFRLLDEHGLDSVDLSELRQRTQPSNDSTWSRIWRRGRG